jgi:hypothetical protein
MIRWLNDCFHSHKIIQPKKSFSQSRIQSWLESLLHFFFPLLPFFPVFATSGQSG